jgi:N-acetylglucosaminyldiphosphoundecaprenol N-acetyl-beta-D-mannosaminyltransferase
MGPHKIVNESSIVLDQLQLSPRPAVADLDPSPTLWPRKCDLLGVHVSATTYDEVCDVIVSAVRAEQPAVVSFHAVHAIVTSNQDGDLLRKVNKFDLVAPDGQPVRWALNRLYNAGLRDRVCGPELMLRLCDRAALEGIPIYLYGSSPEVIKALSENLIGRYDGLVIAGAESPPFRKLTAEEDQEMVDRINDSGAGIVFIGLGCPKQDHFAADHQDRIRGVQVCVGAAFDFHAGVKKPAPVWMQRRGLEWVYRLIQEPRRLWRRYLVTNTLFVQKFLFQWGRMWLRGLPSTNQN